MPNESNSPAEFKIVLEYLEGGSLSDLLAKDKYLSEIECWYLLTQILSALSYCHANNIVYRDCKLENLLLTYNDESISHNGVEFATVKLIDFGFAAFSATDNLSGICGTPEYIAPEVIGHQLYGKAVDMWSLGVVAFVLSSSQYPFKGNRLEEIFECIRVGKFEWITGSNASCSEPFKYLVSNLLSLNPKDRPSAKSALAYVSNLADSISALT